MTAIRHSAPCAEDDLCIGPTRGASVTVSTMQRSYSSIPSHERTVLILNYFFGSWTELLYGAQTKLSTYSITHEALAVGRSRH